MTGVAAHGRGRDAARGCWLGSPSRQTAGKLA
jgi:hypothetical protein